MSNDLRLRLVPGAQLRLRYQPSLPVTAVRYDLEQSLSVAEKLQARTNIGAAGDGDVATDDALSPVPLVQAEGVTLDAAVGLIVPDYYEIATGAALDVGLAAVFEVT